MDEPKNGTEAGDALQARSSTQRSREARERKRMGVVLVEMEIGPDVLDALVERGTLAADRRDDKAAVAEAMLALAARRSAPGDAAAPSSAGEARLISLELRSADIWRLAHLGLIDYQEHDDDAAVAEALVALIARSAAVEGLWRLPVEQERAWMRSFVESGRWTEDNQGPRPFTRGCIVSADVIAEFQEPLEVDLAELRDVAPPGARPPKRRLLSRQLQRVLLQRALQTGEWNSAQDGPPPASPESWVDDHGVRTSFGLEPIHSKGVPLDAIYGDPDDPLKSPRGPATMR